MKYVHICIVLKARCPTAHRQLVSVRVMLRRNQDLPTPTGTLAVITCNQKCGTLLNSVPVPRIWGRVVEESDAAWSDYR